MTYDNQRCRDRSLGHLVAILLTGLLLTGCIEEDSDLLGESVANLRWNTPSALITEHVNWHTQPCGVNGGRSCEHRGTNFLEFHRDYLNRLKAAGEIAHLTKKQMSAWKAVPDEILDTPVWSEDQLRALNRLSSPDQTTFCRIASNLDDFGAFIEFGPHGAMHNGAFATLTDCGGDHNGPGDCVIGGFMSPRSTIFFQIHGMIENWHTRFRNECL